MLMFETILALLLGASVLAGFARRLSVPYPSLLALGGVLIALLPGGPRLELPPDLILALFVAPVLLDAAYDTSLRDLRKNWLAILGLVLFAVGLSTLAAAFVARLFLPDLSWAAAIALGALLAPPDAVAALAVLRQVNPPYRIRMVLEGESLLNDASALLIYRLAVGTVVAGGFNVGAAIPAFVLVVFGSVAVGWLFAWPVTRLAKRMEDAPSAAIFQFVMTFSLWLAAERLGLSGVVTIVVFGLTAARRGPPMPAHLRVPTFAIWESATVVLNVLAFTLIGLQIRPILEPLTGAERLHYAGGAIAVLGAVIVVRIGWVMTYYALVRLKDRVFGHRSLMAPPTAKGAVVVGWSGMRGIVTLAAAMALPPDFPHRDFMQLAAFVVVLGTLGIQGFTLRPLLQLLRLPKDNTVEAELGVAREAALKAVIAVLDRENTPAAQRLKIEYGEALNQARLGRDPRSRPDNALRQNAVTVAREAIDDLRSAGAIGDEAYRQVEQELDLLELSSQPARE